jgi:hypothetical protein
MRRRESKRKQRTWTEKCAGSARAIARPLSQQQMKRKKKRNRNKSRRRARRERERERERERAKQAGVATLARRSGIREFQQRTIIGERRCIIALRSRAQATFWHWIQRFPYASPTRRRNQSFRTRFPPKSITVPRLSHLCRFSRQFRHLWLLYS